MTRASTDLTWSRLAVLAIACASLGLPGTTCNPPGNPVNETVLTILAKSPGSSFAFPNQAKIEGEIQEVRDFYLEASYGQVVHIGADDPSVGSDWIGPFEIPGSIICGAESLYTEAVIQTLGDLGTVDFTRYDHVVVVTPNPGCGTNGLDFSPGLFDFGDGFIVVDSVFINAQSLYFGGNGTDGAGLVVHELGHQYGLGHAGGLRCFPLGTIAFGGCDEGEYLDLIDTMGSSLFFGQFNAVHKEQLGWLAPSEVVEVTTSGQYAIGAFEIANNGPKVLKLRRQNDSWLYIEYRTPVGFDNIPIPGFTDGAVFHMTRPGSPFSGSYILLGPGGYAVQPGQVMQDERGHRIEVVSKTPEGILLDVTYTPPVEGVPPVVSAFRSAGSGPGLLKATITASDASGIGRVEVYTKKAGPGNFDWTTLELLGFVDSPGGTSEIEFPAASVDDALEAVAYDGEGNVARRPF